MSVATLEWVKFFPSICQTQSGTLDVLAIEARLTIGFVRTIDLYVLGYLMARWVAIKPPYECPITPILF